MADRRPPEAPSAWAHHGKRVGAMAREQSRIGITKLWSWAVLGLFNALALWLVVGGAPEWAEKTILGLFWTFALLGLTASVVLAIVGLIDLAFGRSPDLVWGRTEEVAEGRQGMVVLGSSEPCPMPRHFWLAVGRAVIALSLSAVANLRQLGQVSSPEFGAASGGGARRRASLLYGQKQPAGDLRPGDGPAALADRQLLARRLHPARATPSVCWTAWRPATS